MTAQTTTISKTADQGSPWGKLWQVPLAFAGILIFAWGVRMLVVAHKPPPFARQAAAIRQMIRTGRYDAAIQEINALYNFYKKPAEQARLSGLLGDAYFLGQRAQIGFIRKNYRRAQRAYGRAKKLGLLENAAMASRWGEADFALEHWRGAIRHLRRALKLAPNRLATLARPLTEACLEARRPQRRRARACVRRVLALKNASVPLRIWALCQDIRLSMQKPELNPLVQRALAMARAVQQPRLVAPLYVWIGQALLEEGQVPAAQAALQSAEKLFLTPTLNDGRAKLLLGNIAQGRRQLKTARRLYENVIANHTGSALAPAARLGLAQTLAESGHAGKRMRRAYRRAIFDLMARGRRHRPEFINKNLAYSALQQQFERYRQKLKFRKALEFLRLTRLLKLPPTQTFALEEATSQRRRGDILRRREKASVGAAPAVRNRLFNRALNRYAKAAAAYDLDARLSAVSDVGRSRQSIWRAAQMYDACGRPRHAVAEYRRFINRFPASPRRALAIYKIAMLYSSVGNYPQAIRYFGRDIKAHARAPSTYQSYAQLARAYIAENPPNYAQARKTLLALLRDNRNISPAAKEFRSALFLLGRVYFREGNYSHAILRLEEAIQRYPDDPRVAKATFYLAESFRDSAVSIETYLRKHIHLPHRQRFLAARANRLRRAARLYGQVVARFAARGRSVALLAKNPVARRLMRYSNLYEGDCRYDQGRYHQAMAVYTKVAGRYVGTATATQANVQIVACLLALHETGRARAAAARAAWLLKHAPKGTFGRRKMSPGRAYFSGLLALLEKK